MTLTVRLAAFVLALMALAHLLRLVLGVNLVVGGASIPSWVSTVAFIVFALLSLLLWRERGWQQQVAVSEDFLQVEIGDWDLSQERQFMENLFCQRFNFFIVIFSLVVAGAATADTAWKLNAVLIIGLVVCKLVWLTVYRNYVKLIWILKRLHKEAHHPVAVSGRAIKALGARGLFGVNPIIGIWIPAFCCVTLLLAAVLALRGVLTVGK